VLLRWSKWSGSATHHEAAFSCPFSIAKMLLAAFTGNRHRALCCYSKQIQRVLICLLLDLLSRSMLCTWLKHVSMSVVKCKHRSPKDSTHRNHMHSANIPTSQHICLNMFTDSVRHDTSRVTGADARTPLWICHAAQSALYIEYQRLEVSHRI
jgi:hypothetical protein